MRMFTEYVAWQNYAATEFATAEVTEERADSNVRRVQAMAMINANPTKGGVTVAKANNLFLPEVERALQEQLNAYASRKMTQVILTNCERCAALVSRELSRRIGSSGVERRNQRLAP
jgi:hypothetical protein